MRPDPMDTNRSCMLIIDDDGANREVLKNIFAEDFCFLEAENGLEGLKIIEAQEKGLCAILLDVEMPKMTGLELLKILHERDVLSQIPAFLITAREELEVAREAYGLGVMGVIVKPLVPFIVERRVHTVVELFRAREALGNRVRQQEQTIQKNVETIDALHRNTLEAMASAIEFRDVESGEHINRMYGITKLILQKTDMGRGFTEEEIENMAIGSIMHDVGKIAISDMILNKPGKLSEDEFEIMKTHTLKGFELMEQLSRVQSHPSYQYAMDIARHHHERWDGRGYPDGLKGEQITVWSQVVSIADVYDALVSPRVYKKAFSADKALDMILAGECGAFNPRLLECFLKIEPELRRMYQQKATAGIGPGDGRITMEKQDQKPARDPMDAMLLAAAVQQVYDMVICANLTQNSFYIVDDEHFRTHCHRKEGIFDDLIASGESSIPESHKRVFLDHFARENLLAAFARGERTVSLNHPQYADDGAVMDVVTRVLLMEDMRNGDVRDITLVRYKGEHRF